MKKQMTVTAYVGIDDVREYLEGLHGEMLSSSEQTRIDAGMDAAVITQVMGNILCTQAGGMNKKCSLYRQLSECFYEEDIDRAVEEVTNYLTIGDNIQLEHENKIVEALKGVTDPKTWAEIASENWSDTEKWQFIKQLVCGKRGYHDLRSVIEEITILSEMA